MDYRVYHLSRKEVCKSITLAGLLTAVVAYLFYASWLGIVFFLFLSGFHEASEKAGRADAITACEGICGYSPEYQCGFTCWFLYRKCVERGRKRNTRIIWEKILYVSGGKGDELFHQPQSTIGAAAGRFLNPKWKYGYCKFFRSFFICKTQRWKFCDNY